MGIGRKQWTELGSEAANSSHSKKTTIALACDWLTTPGGAEKVLLELHKMYPSAPIYTSQYSKKGINWFDDADVRTGWLQIFPRALRKFLGPLRQIYFSHLDLSDYNVVISVTGAEAKAIKTKKDAKKHPISSLYHTSDKKSIDNAKSDAYHLCYCHVPTQYYWQMYDKYVENPGFGILNPLVRLCFKLLIKPLRKADYRAVQQPDQFVTISEYAKEQIKKYYNREAIVIAPPVEVEKFTPKTFKKPQKPNFSTTNSRNFTNNPQLGRELSTESTNFSTDQSTKTPKNQALSTKKTDFSTSKTKLSTASAKLSHSFSTKPLQKSTKTGQNSTTIPQANTNFSTENAHFPTSNPQSIPTFSTKTTKKSTKNPQEFHSNEATYPPNSPTFPQNQNSLSTKERNFSTTIPQCDAKFSTETSDFSKFFPQYHYQSNRPDQIPEIICPNPPAYYIIACRQATWKRVDLAIKACQQLNLPLLVVGDGSEHANLVKLANNSANIEFLPWTDARELAKLLQGAKAYIFPSLEPFGVAAVEALAAGCPVIAYAEGGSRDFIKNRQNGLLFDKQSVESLAKALETFQNLHFDRQTVSQSAVKFATSHFRQKIENLIKKESHENTK